MGWTRSACCVQNGTHKYAHTRSTVGGCHKKVIPRSGCCCSITATTSKAYGVIQVPCSIIRHHAEDNCCRTLSTLMLCCHACMQGTRGFHGPAWLKQVGMAPRGYLPSFAILKAQSTRHSSRPGLAFAPWCTRGPPGCHAGESAREDRRPEEKKNRFRRKSVLHIHTHVGLPTAVGCRVFWLLYECHITTFLADLHTSVPPVLPANNRRPTLTHLVRESLEQESVQTRKCF